MQLEYEALTGGIIGAAIEVHRQLGPGFLESIYESALAIELTSRRIPFERQIGIPILYRNAEVGVHRLDLYVADQIVVELKAVKDIEDVHYAIVHPT
jgi:GxxExxY protein